LRKTGLLTRGKEREVLDTLEFAKGVDAVSQDAGERVPAGVKFRIDSLVLLRISCEIG
jgi:hypothetical protein